MGDSPIELGSLDVDEPTDVPAERARARELFEALGSVVIYVDRAWSITEVTTGAVEVFTEDGAELVGRKVTSLIAPFDPVAVFGIEDLLEPRADADDISVSMVSARQGVFTASLRLASLDETWLPATRVLEIRDISRHQEALANQERLTVKHAEKAIELQKANAEIEALNVRLNRAADDLQDDVDAATAELREQAAKLEELNAEKDRNLVQIRAREREAQDLNTYLASVLAALTESVLILDVDYRVQSVNAVFTALVGKDDALLVGVEFVELLDDADLLKLVGAAKLFDEGGFRAINVGFSDKDGGPVTLKSSGSEVMSPTGDLLGYVIVGHDEREMRRLLSLESQLAAREREQAAELLELHEELKETSKRELEHASNLLMQSEKLSQLGSMLASIAHEINNPVGVIQTSNSLVDRMVDELDHEVASLDADDEESQACCASLRAKLADLKKINKVAITGSKRLGELSHALRTQSRMDLEVTRDVNVNTIAREALVIAQGRIKFCDVEVELGELPLITCFRSKLGQVVTNLLSNAGDSLFEKNDQHRDIHGYRYEAKIRVTSEARERDGQPGVSLAVADNGDGVPEDIREKIFEEYFTTKPAGVGTGLGLAMCMTIAKEHGGAMAVTEDPVLGGARFEMWLPLSPPKEDVDQ